MAKGHAEWGDLQLVKQTPENPHTATPPPPPPPSSHLMTASLLALSTRSQLSGFSPPPPLFPLPPAHTPDDRIVVGLQHQVAAVGVAVDDDEAVDARGVGNEVRLRLRVLRWGGGGVEGEGQCGEAWGGVGRS